MMSGKDAASIPGGDAPATPDGGSPVVLGDDDHVFPGSSA